MVNVVKFHEEASRRRRNTNYGQELATAEISGLKDHFRNLQFKAKAELRDAILLLDLAAQQAHQLIRAINDPALKKLLKHDLSIIEELLQLARGKTSQL